MTGKSHHLKINGLLLDLMMSCSDHPKGFLRDLVHKIYAKKASFHAGCKGFAGPATYTEFPQLSNFRYCKLS